MTFFVDTNVIVYAVAESPWRTSCDEVLAAVAARGEGRTSCAVLEELWHVERSGRVAGIAGITDRAYRLFAPLLSATDAAFRLARDLTAPRRLGTNDRLHVGTCLDHGIGTVVTADESFREVTVVAHVDPRNDRARRRLLG